MENYPYTPFMAKDVIKLGTVIGGALLMAYGMSVASGNIPDFALIEIPGIAMLGYGISD